MKKRSSPCTTAPSASRLLRCPAALAALTLLLAGCMGPTVTSSADKTYSKIVSRLYILADLPDTGWQGSTMFNTSSEVKMQNFKQFKETMEKKFKKMGVESLCDIRTGIELDDSIYVKSITSFKPDALFLVTCVGVTLQKGQISGAEFNCSLIDAVTNKRFWRANISIDTRSGLIGTIATGNKVAGDLHAATIKQLKADGMDVFSTLEPL